MCGSVSGTMMRSMHWLSLLDYPEHAHYNCYSMKHPIAEQNKNQRQFLEQLESDQEREFHAKMFRIGNASYCYYQMAQTEVDLTSEDFKEWLEGLPDIIKSDMSKKGFESCKTNLSFRRYVLEKSDYGMDEWMKENLSKADFIYWGSTKKSEFVNSKKEST